MSLQPEAVAELALLERGIRDAIATRYLSIAGTVILTYDHLLTINDEIHVWRAKSSLSNWLFLFNRYFVVIMLFIIAQEMCGLNEHVYSDEGCRWFLSATSLLGLISTAVANLLVLFRVLLLWQDNKPIRILLWTTYGLSTCLMLSLMVVSCVKLWDTGSWSSFVNMCVIQGKTPFFAALWGTPVFFEITVLSTVVFSTIASPRSAQLPLRNALQRDGITFFLTVLSLRVFNAIIAGVAGPGLTTLGVYFVWGILTTVLNRSLLRMRKAEILQLQSASPAFGRATSPFAPFGIPSEMELRIADPKYIPAEQLDMITWRSNNSRKRSDWF